MLVCRGTAVYELSIFSALPVINQCITQKSIELLCRARKRNGNGCGRGYKHRLVICRSSLGTELDRSHCLAEDRPIDRQSCQVPCNTRRRRRRQQYKWKKGMWSPCSEECDQGKMSRSISCHDMIHPLEIKVHDHRCIEAGRRKPRITQGCNKTPCPFRWVTTLWSECSKLCGTGAQTRTVTCHAVSSLNWMDPDPVALDSCNSKKKPSEVRNCNMGPCSHNYFWHVKPWKPCMAPCGHRGRQRRKVWCQDSHGRRVGRRYCLRQYRPKKKQRCWAGPCGYTSCAQVKEALNVTVDGEYELNVAGKNMSIHCHNMSSTVPLEYLAMPAGEEGNYAEIYNKRLRQPDTCPHNGQRHDNCDCVDDTSRRAGYTLFRKIRLNTTSLVVDTYDFTFARLVEGERVAYGEAGDCYSTHDCPQGSFSINLVGTPLRVSSRTVWKSQGNKAAMRMNRLDKQQRILGWCGGYCGSCRPDPAVGLKLAVRES